MVQRAAGDRQAEALDRVGEDDGRALGLGAGRRERVEDVGEVVAAEILDERPDATSVVGQEPLQARLLGRVERSRRRASVTTSSEAPKRLWYSWFGISSMRRRSSSPPSRAYASRSRRPYFSSSTCQPLRRNDALELHRLDDRDDAVEALAVEVDDPEDVRRGRASAARDRLPDVALVELGVAEERDEAPGPGRAVAEMGLDVAVGERAEERRRGAEADRARGVVDGVRVLRAARVRLQAPERA